MNIFGLEDYKEDLMDKTIEPFFKTTGISIHSTYHMLSYDTTLFLIFGIFHSLLA